MNTIDPIALEIYWSRAIAISNEMMATLIRTSFSTVIRVNKDCSAAIFDERGEMLAQPDHSAPAHIGCMPGVMRRILDEYKDDRIKPGDVFITNDPWIGAGHTPDVYVAEAVFRGDHLLGFTVTVAHHLDIGGRMGSTDSQDVYEEGLLIPLLRLYDGGRKNEDVFRILSENVRMPHIFMGDLDAQIAANRVGAKRLLELATDYDLDGFGEITDAIISTSEAAMRAEIAALPDGRYPIEEVLDLKDEEGEPLVIKLVIEVDGDRVSFDYSGSSRQIRRPVNCVLNYTVTFSVLAMKMALLPHLPHNGGIQRPIEVSAPEGSMLNAVRPAAVWRRTVIGMRLPNIIFKALSRIMPEKIIAGNGSSPMWLWLFSGWRPGMKRFAFQTHFMGGLGAGIDNDGLNTASFPSSVTDTPVEIFENVCPVVIERRELIADSGGAGAHRGGLGQVLEISPTPGRLGQLDGPITVAYSAGGLEGGPEGLDAGHDGSLGRVEVNGEPLSKSLATIQITEKDRVTLRLPGGGGFQSPLRRDPEAVRKDVLSGYITAEAARDQYGVVFAQSGKDVDEGETAKLRQSLGATAPGSDDERSVGDRRHPEHAGQERHSMATAK